MTKNDGDVTMRELAAAEREEALQLLNDTPVAGPSIRFARKAIGLRRDQLAKKFGFTLSEMEDVEIGNIRLDEDKLVALTAMVKGESPKAALTKSERDTAAVLRAWLDWYPLRGAEVEPDKMFYDIADHLDDMGLADVDNHAASPKGADLLRRAGLMVET